MYYTTVFDVSWSGLRNLWLPLLGVVFIAAGFGIFKWGEGRAVYLGFVFMAFASIWTLLMLATTFGDYFSLFSDLRNGRCQVVEGPVQQFIPMRADGHGEESFVVAGHPFRYSDNVITAGFNQSASHGGPIREGLPVRIHYRRDEIAKLEIASPPP